MNQSSSSVLNNNNQNKPVETAYVSSPLGILSIKGNKHGIQSIMYEDEAKNISEKVPQELQSCYAQLMEYFDCQRTTFSFLINQSGTDFQQRVWQELGNIPFGKTISYLQLSKNLGNVKAIRAAAAANGKNKLNIVVPCHRVIGSNGSLTGYAGGLHRKKWLLDFENKMQGRLFE